MKQCIILNVFNITSCKNQIYDILQAQYCVSYLPVSLVLGCQGSVVKRCYCSGNKACAGTSGSIARDVQLCELMSLCGVKKYYMSASLLCW
jgi:hypothetical protein